MYVAYNGEHVPHQLMQEPVDLDTTVSALIELLNMWRSRAHWMDVERTAMWERLQRYEGQGTAMPDKVAEKVAEPKFYEAAGEHVFSGDKMTEAFVGNVSPEQMAAVRAKNTALEEGNRELYRALDETRRERDVSRAESVTLRQENRELRLQIDQMAHERSESLRAGPGPSRR